MGLPEQTNGRDLTLRRKTALVPAIGNDRLKAREIA